MRDLFVLKSPTSGERNTRMRRIRADRKYIVSLLVISVVLIILDLVFFGLAIARSPSNLIQVADLRTLYSVYWFGLPLLLTALVGIIAGARGQKALITGFMVLSIITCVLAATTAVLFLLLVYILCGSFENGRVGRDGKTCDIKEPINAIYIAMVTDAALICVCCLIGSICACYHTCACCYSRTRDEPEVITLTPLSAKPPDDPFS